jgi:hypothetical protein
MAAFICQMHMCVEEMDYHSFFFWTLNFEMLKLDKNHTEEICVKNEHGN